MSFNTSVASITAGLGLITYGGYKHNVANQNAENSETAVAEAAKQKKMGLGIVAVGVASVFAGAALLYFTPPTPEELEAARIAQLEAIKKTQEQFKVRAETAIRLVHTKLKPWWDKCCERIDCCHEPMVNLFRSLDKSLGISTNNFLPWKREYNVSSVHNGNSYIQRILPEDMKLPVMWTKDPLHQFNLAVKYSCNLVDPEDVIIKTINASRYYWQRYDIGDVRFGTYGLETNVDAFTDTCREFISSTATDSRDFFSQLKEFINGKKFTKIDATSGNKVTFELQGT